VSILLILNQGVNVRFQPNHHYLLPKFFLIKSSSGQSLKASQLKASPLNLEDFISILNVAKGDAVSPFYCTSSKIRYYTLKNLVLKVLV
jgi:hypothetical protein